VVVVVAIAAVVAREVMTVQVEEPRQAGEAEEDGEHGQ